MGKKKSATRNPQWLTQLEYFNCKGFQKNRAKTEYRRDVQSRLCYPPRHRKVAVA